MESQPSKRRRKSLAFGAILAAFAVGCTHKEPPTWDAGDGSLAVAPLPEIVDAGDAGAAYAGPTDAGVADAPPVDPGTLPQTRDRPRSSTPGFDARAHALWDAIVSDDPDRALPAFFPSEAYKQVKAIPSPETDYKRRLIASFTRDIHRLHERLGSRAADATFTELEIASERARWVEPNEESNKIGYWRVFGSKLRYKLGENAASFDVGSLISWRGEWYVVHLTFPANH
jgi:hypothetical protein